MSEEQTLRENVKSREVVPRDKQRSYNRPQPAEQRSRSIRGQNRKRSGKQQQRRKPRSSAGSIMFRSNAVSGRTNRKSVVRKRNQGTPKRLKEMCRLKQRAMIKKKVPKDFDRNGLDKAQEMKQSRGEAQSTERSRRTEKSDGQDKSPRGGDRSRRDRKKWVKNDLAFRAEKQSKILNATLSA